MAKTFEKDLENLINYYSREGDSDTPDFILAQYLLACMDAFATTVKAREAWHGRLGSVGQQPLAGGE